MEEEEGEGDADDDDGDDDDDDDDDDNDNDVVVDDVDEGGDYDVGVDNDYVDYADDDAQFRLCVARLESNDSHWDGCSGDRMGDSTEVKKINSSD